MRFVKLTVLSFFCLLAISAEAKTFNAETFALENGMQVVVIPNHRAPVVSHMVWYRFGRADERAGESGIAHFLEHLMFKGTPAVPDGQFSARVRKMGGKDNAFTTRDYTAYYQNVAKEHLPEVMAMEADRMKNLVLKEEQVASEREVIVEERRQRVDNQPQALLDEQVTAALYVNHPYAVPVIGWLHEIRGLTRAMALDYYGRWYAPNNAILVVAGDVTAKELRPLAEKYYGPLEPSEDIPPRARPLPAPLTAKIRMGLSDPRVGMPLLAKTWRAPRGSDALEILEEIFGNSTTSRLYRSLVVEQKVAVSAGMDYEAISLNDTALSVYASPAPGVEVARLEAALDAEIARLLEKGVTQDELNAAKKRKKAGFTYYLDSLQGPAMLFGRAVASGFDPDYLENWPERIDRLTVEAVNKAAALIFAGENQPVVSLLTPAAETEKEGKKK